MPKEITSFRVNFEETAWLKMTDVNLQLLTQNEFPFEITRNPVNFNIQCAGNVAITDLYTEVALSEFEISNNKINGTLFNYGIQEVTFQAC
jgi:hypothetical protein